ncbi:UNVERIFIED_CONTAM: 60S ribosomal protein L6 [Sesamum latifolium]|uniref:60S ribosomal protein L6 n=1 Tax=Sesamum latifolium TaxID=2727402 RepID=A0AAW2XHV1_9LAMI
MAPKAVRVTRNSELILSVRKISRSKMYHKRGLRAVKAPGATPVVEKPPKFYPADDIKKLLSNKRKPKAKPTKHRAGIIPGTFLILMAVRFNVIVCITI